MGRSDERSQIQCVLCHHCCAESSLSPFLIVRDAHAHTTVITGHLRTVRIRLELVHHASVTERFLCHLHHVACSVREPYHTIPQ